MSKDLDKSKGINKFDKVKENDKKKGDDNMNTATVERYCTVEESIEQSCKEIKNYDQGKINFKSLDESFAQWQQWANKFEDE